MNWRKYVLPSALIVALAAGLAVAQNINKAIQLSQDPTGAIGVDTNNNIYFPGHLLTVGPATPPALSGCGTTPTITGTDTMGTVTEGTGSPTGCTLTFNRAYLATPYCMITWAATPPTTQTQTPALTTLSTIHTAANSSVFTYICSGSK